MSLVPAWSITKDHIPTAGLDRTGTKSRHLVRDDQTFVEFRLYDDDGELYYEGAIAESWLAGDESRAFAPLDWGHADAGCTRMDYKDADGSWRTL